MKDINYKVSVRLMTYNHELFIREALESVMSQKTTFPVEVVVGDDFSTDRTLDIVREFSDTDNITINILDRPEGGEYAREREKYGRLYNFADILSNCSGEYIAWLDGDDYWGDESKLQQQVSFLDANPEYVIHFHDSLTVSEDDQVISRTRIANRNNTRSVSDIIQGFVMTTNVIMHRNLNIAVPLDFYEASNGDSFYLVLLGHYGKAWFDPDIKPSVYREHGSSVWSKLGPMTKLEKSYRTIRLVTKHIDPEYRHLNYRRRASAQWRILAGTGGGVLKKLDQLVDLTEDLALYGYYRVRNQLKGGPVKPAR